MAVKWKKKGKNEEEDKDGAAAHSSSVAVKALQHIPADRQRVWLSQSTNRADSWSCFVAGGTYGCSGYESPCYTPPKDSSARGIIDRPAVPFLVTTPTTQGPYWSKLWIKSLEQTDLLSKHTWRLQDCKHQSRGANTSKNLTAWLLNRSIFHPIVY